MDKKAQSNDEVNQCAGVFNVSFDGDTVHTQLEVEGLSLDRIAVLRMHIANLTSRLDGLINEVLVNTSEVKHSVPLHVRDESNKEPVN